ncbi:hypothetical protein ILYODFUR_038495 [Ilyodon furcidens]|uniref:Uncharacterized protein n=1 Tax=Ilyodon furcidens TaxID=33524 RepID=A0ABV0TEL6_9TELE
MLAVSTSGSESTRRACSLLLRRPGSVKTAADRRKRNNDQHVQDSPLHEGQLVLIRETSQQGRHKIQDLWSTKVHVQQPPSSLAVNLQMDGNRTGSQSSGLQHLEAPS